MMQFTMESIDELKLRGSNIITMPYFRHAPKLWCRRGKNTPTTGSWYRSILGIVRSLIPFLYARCETLIPRGHMCRLEIPEGMPLILVCQ